MQLRYYAWVIWHTLWIILLGSGTCAGATYLISNHIKPVYQASALIQVNESGTNANNSNVFTDQALAIAEALLVTSPEVLQRAAQELPGVSASQLKNAVSASPLADTEIIEVRAQAANPQLAANIANTVVKVFIQLQVARQTAQLQAIADQLSQQLVTAKANIDAAQRQLTKLQNSGASADKIAHQEDVLNGYQTDYNSLSASYQQIQLQELRVGSINTEVQSATPPDAPVSPRVLLNTIIASAMGLLLMIVLVLLLDWMDTTIKTPEDVAQLAMLESLGSVPFSRRPPSLVNPQNTSFVDEAIEQAFMIIGTSFSVLNRGQRSVLVTSLRRGAGTSTTASKLAISLAQSGKRVLLIDANLHRPSLHKAFNRSNTRGLANCLTDVSVLQVQIGLMRSWLSQWITDIPNLWLLPAGPAPASPTMILRAPELGILMECLLQPYWASSGQQIPNTIDIVIFDTPALEEGADSVALTPLTDNAVLVIEAGRERSEALNKASITLQRVGSPVLGVVVNRQRAQHRSYFYVNHSQQISVAAESTRASPPVKYPVLKTKTSWGDTPPETPLPIEVSRSARLSLGRNYDITEQVIPSTPPPLDGQSKGLYKSQFQSPLQLNNAFHEDPGGWLR